MLSQGPWTASLNEIDRFVNRIFDAIPFGGHADRPATPPVNIVEYADRLVIVVDLPGVEENEIDVKLNGNELTISTERKHAPETKDGAFHRLESHFGKIGRTLTLPDDLQTDAIEALYKQGSLTLTLPKAKEKTAKIHVKSA
jgi:HSP20 family protein